jgi:hypothetical protein
MPMRWHRAFVVSALVFASGCPDKNSPERRARATLARFEVFADDMCRCKDKPCADKVQESMTVWATEMAKEAGNKADERPSEETMKKMTDLGQRYAECMTKAMMTAHDEVAVPPVRDDVPPATSSREADKLVRAAKDFARVKHPEHVATDLSFDYVDANGELDAEHGRVAVLFGRVKVKPNDPKRKIGAPVPPPQKEHTDCFQLEWTPKNGWDRSGFRCDDAFDVTNKCSTTQVWRKAIDAKAPETALATLRFNTTAAGGDWVFAIKDEPRDIHIHERFDDDCPLAVEK